MPGRILVFFSRIIRPRFFLDEIQHAPELLSSIKRQVDRLRQKSLYILSGSQHLSVMRDIAESLAGRVALAHLYPMTRREVTGLGKGNFLEKLGFRTKPGYTRMEPKPRSCCIP